MGDFSAYIESLSSELERKSIEYQFETPVVSIIVPVYNLEDLVYDSIISLVNQTFKNIEIIILNDGSTDNSGSICSVFAQYDKRIRLITQANTGLGVARNNALKYARGKYVLFVDGDDFLVVKAIETLVSTIEKEGCELVVFGAYNYANNKTSLGSYSYQKISKKLRGKLLNNKLVLNHLFGFPRTAWSKLYKKDFILKNNLTFQANVTGEDQSFFIKAFLNASKVYVLEQNLYYYRRSRKNSLTFSKVRDTTDLIKIFYDIEAFIFEKNNDEYLKVIIHYVNKAVVGLAKCSKKYRDVYFEELEKMLSYCSGKYPLLGLNLFNINKYDSYIILKLKLFLHFRLLRGKRCLM